MMLHRGRAITVRLAGSLDITKKDKEGENSILTLRLSGFPQHDNTNFFSPENERWVGMWKNKNREIEGERGLLLHARDLVRME
jgi:hypothetical protein